MILLLLISLGWWRSTAVGSQVQVPMFYDAHYLFPRAWTQEQAAPGVPEDAPLAFYGENRVSQQLISGADNLAMVELWLSGEPDQTVSVSLTDDQGQSFEVQQMLTKGREGGYYRFAFPPYANAKGRSFRLTLFAPLATVENPVVTHTVGGDRLGGSLRINEYNSPGNLALASYSRGLPGPWWFEAIGEQILPDLFYLRLQQYKPFPFKGSSFALVLLITFFLSIMFLVLAKPQNRASMRTLQRSLGWTAALILGLFLLWQLGDGRVKLSFIARSSDMVPVEDAIAVAAPAGSGQRMVRDIISDLWTLEREPEARFMHTDLVAGLPAVRVPHQSAISFNIDVAPEIYLVGGVAAEGQGSLQVNLQVAGESIFSKELAADPAASEQNISWFELDLSPWTGQPVTVQLKSEGSSEGVEGIWIMPRIETSAPWLLKTAPPDLLDLPVQMVQFDNTVTLLGSVLADPVVRPGESLDVDLFWQTEASSERYAKVFVHLFDSAGNLVAQSDSQPVQNAYPIPIWQPEAIIRDSHSLVLPDDLPAGTYQLYVGLYDPDTLERWSVTDDQGSTVLNDAVLLQPPIEVIP